MKKIVVQIYEVQDPAEAQALIELGVDHIGSVIVSERDWKLPLVKDTIRAVKSAGAKSSLIPLYNHPHAVFRTLDYYQPDMIHFCEALADRNDDGPTLADLIRLQAQVKERYPQVRIIRSIPVVQPDRQTRMSTLKLSRKFEPVSDYFLTDTLLVNKEGDGLDRQPVEGFVGITGQTCDWVIARKLVAESQIPVILAGGLCAQNVAAAIQSVQPAGVDSCTQTNMQALNGQTIRFKKDLEKVRAFVEAVKAAEKSMDSV